MPVRGGGRGHHAAQNHFLLSLLVFLIQTSFMANAVLTLPCAWAPLTVRNHAINKFIRNRCRYSRWFAAFPLRCRHSRFCATCCTVNWNSFLRLQPVYCKMKLIMRLSLAIGNRHWSQLWKVSGEFHILLILPSTVCWKIHFNQHRLQFNSCSRVWMVSLNQYGVRPLVLMPV